MRKYIIDEISLRRLIIKELKYDSLCENGVDNRADYVDTVANYQYIIDYALNSFPVYKECD